MTSLDRAATIHTSDERDNSCKSKPTMKNDSSRTVGTSPLSCETDKAPNFENASPVNGPEGEAESGDRRRPSKNDSTITEPTEETSSSVADGFVFTEPLKPFAGGRFYDGPVGKNSAPAADAGKGEKERDGNSIMVRRKQLSDLLKIAKRIQLNRQRIEEMERICQARSEGSHLKDMTTLTTIESKIEKIECERSALYLKIGRKRGLFGLFRPDDEELRKRVNEKDKEIGALTKQQIELSTMMRLRKDDEKKLELLRRDVDFLLGRQKILEQNLGEHLPNNLGSLKAASTRSIASSCESSAQSSTQSSYCHSLGGSISSRGNRSRRILVSKKNRHDRYNRTDSLFSFDKAEKFQSRPAFSYTSTRGGETSRVAQNNQVGSFVFSSSNKKKATVSSLLSF